MKKDDEQYRFRQEDEERKYKMKKFKRIFVVVMDSVGIGAMPDAQRYGDGGTDTIGHTAAAVGGLSMPNMERLGYGNLHPIQGIHPQRDPQGYYRKRYDDRTLGDDGTVH